MIRSPQVIQAKEVLQFTSVLVPVDIATANAPPKYVALDNQCRNYVSEEGLPEYEMGSNIKSV